MPYESLEEFIKAADAVGEVRYVEGADLELDVGCLTELMAERDGPMLVFDNFAKFPPAIASAPTPFVLGDAFLLRSICRSICIQ